MSAANMPLTIDERLKHRFWSKVRKLEGDNACWLWTGASRVGYGSIKVSGTVINCHVLSWRLNNGGIAVPDGKLIGHLCDVRLCVRPDHLKLMTFSENIRDAHQKNRYSWSHGELAPNSVLTDDIVREARRLHADGMAVSEIARKLETSYEALKGVFRGRTWKHVK